MATRIVLGSDHGGFALKEHLKGFLQKKGFEVVDYGTYSEEAVDYPDFAHLVAQRVAHEPDSLGIIIDGAGTGSAITANKVPGVRAAPCYDTFVARNSRAHNSANVLTLGSRATGLGLAEQIVETWISTPFEGGRHGRRVAKMVAVEEKYMKTDQAK